MRRSSSPGFRAGRVSCWRMLRWAVVVALGIAFYLSQIVPLPAAPRGHVKRRGPGTVSEQSLASPHRATATTAATNSSTTLLHTHTHTHTHNTHTQHNTTHTHTHAHTHTHTHTHARGVDFSLSTHTRSERRYQASMLVSSPIQKRWQTLAG
jgi:hypothetical protein